MIRGAAPVSAGASGELERLITAINDDPSALALLEADGDPGTTLAELRKHNGPVGDAMSQYLDLVGCRLLDGFDISGRFALEMPDVLLRSIRLSVGGAGNDTDEVDARIAEIRAQVPAEHQAEFDELLGEARLMYRLRDERGVFSDIWASGIMRRAAISAGRRVHAQRLVHDPEHFVDAGFDEMGALVTGTGGPTADELGERARVRGSRTAKDAPPSLGPPAPPPSAGDLRVGVAFVLVDALGAAFVEVDELGVIEAEQVQDRGVQVVDVQAVLDGVQAEVVGRADGLAAFARRRRPSTW